MKKKLHRSEFFKRTVSLAVALIMLLSFLPVVPHAHAAEAQTITVYFRNDWLWTDVRAHYWGSASGETTWPGAEMEKIDTVDGKDVYSVEIPGDITGLIFNGLKDDGSGSRDQTPNIEGITFNDGMAFYIYWDGANKYDTFEYTPEKDEEPDTPDAPVADYYVAGDIGLCGSAWNEKDPANKMTHTGNGVYTKAYANVAEGTYNLKVTDGTWTNSWGDNGQNYTFVVFSACDVTVTFNANTKIVTVTGDGVGRETGLEITSMHAVGDGSGNWMNGKNWDVKANVMTETSADVYEITFENVAAGSYKFKFAANKAWTHSWGGGGADGEAVYNGQDIALSISDVSNVTLKIDLTGYDHSTKTGAAYSVTVTAAEEEPAQVDYYLVGYINGADVGIADDSANLGSYKFVDGKVTVEFTETSYVVIKDSNGTQYWSETYCTDTTVTLKTGAGEKMMVPAGEVTFSLTENADGTLTLSYTQKIDTPEIPEDYNTVTIHFLKPSNWGSTINAYTWGGADLGAWPGSAISANAAHAGWYDLIVVQETPTAFNFIFNDGGNKTGDLATGEVTGNTELWVIGNTVSATVPGEWSGDYDYTANIYFLKPAGWGDLINIYTWNGVDLGEWPGTEMEIDVVNGDWYKASVTMEEDTGFSFIINDGSGNQTADLATGKLNVTTNLWVVDGQVLTIAPAGWIDPARTVHVPGTFPGPNWDAASNQMIYYPNLGLYALTFEDVPAANYEFKIAINGSWTENYGAGGVKDGPNISVAVPETMDVTVYYSPVTNIAVTDVDYKFIMAAVTGTGIEDTALTDPGLTGVYSGTVHMAAGTYTDVAILCGDDVYSFAEITVEKDKNVTFYFDPVTELYYCNSSDIPVDADSIRYNSQLETYKAPYGAVAAGEEVRFAITTGDDIVSAVLVIKGVASVPMEKDENELWTAVTSIANIGEYDYYFALSNGSTVAIYGDDDGYYGEGTVTDLTNVKAYDLVVYEAGFETPDWMKNAVIYQIFPDRFFDGDVTNNQAQSWARGDVDYEYITNWYTLPENPEQKEMLDKDTYLSSGAHYGDGQWSNEIYGGDLEGITQRIDYLKALGVNVIYLNPVFWSISSHRYDAVSYTEIDPILGTLGDFQELVRIAEANDMHIILDGVFNHVSDDSVYFDRYYKFLGKSEKIGAYPYWAYVYDYMSGNGATQSDAETAAKTYFGENYGITDYSYTEWFGVSSATMAGVVDSIGLRAGKEVYSYEGWWGYDSMPVIKSTNGSEYQTGNWAEEIISGDNSVNAYWIGQGMDGWRLDVANEVSDETWQNFRDSVKALNSEAVIIGEIWDDATKYLKGDMYDSVMNYVFRNAVTSYAMGTNSADTAKTMEKLRERYPEEAFYAMMNLVGSHDTSRILSYLDGIGDDRNQKDFDSAFPTYAGTSQLAKDRQYLVSFLQFTYAGAPTIYYGDEIGMVGADDPDDRRAFEWGRGNRELVEWYATLAAIREAYSALRTGSIEMLNLGDSNLLGFVRSDKDDSLTVIANNSQSAKSVSLEGSYINVLTGEAFNGTVPALNGVVLVSAEDARDICVNLSGLAPAYDPSYIVAARPDHDHQWDEGVVTAPTCTEQGYTTYTCAVCGDSYEDDHVAALGHDMGEWMPVENGQERSDCGRCDYYEIREAEVITLEAPVVKVSNVASTGKIKLTWDAVNGAAKYKVYRSTDKKTWTLLKTVTGTSLTNTSTEAGKLYYYYVVAVDKDGNASDASEIVSRRCDLPQPVISLSNVASSGKIKITWEKIEGAVKYEVYRSTDNKTWTLLKTVSGTSLTNTSTEAGGLYYYKVKAIASNSGANSAFSTVESRRCDLAQPSITSLTIISATGKIKVKWGAVEDAVKYELYCSTDGENWTKLITTKGTSVSHNSAVAGTRYYYKVKAIASNTAANSAYSLVKSGTCDLARPTLTVTLNSQDKPALTWNKIDGAAKYQVYVSTDGETWTRLITTTGTRLTHSSAVSGTTYYYKVRAIASNTAANSAYSTVKSITAG